MLQIWNTKHENEYKTVFFFILYHTTSSSYDPRKKHFENIQRNRENDGDQHFLIFPQLSILPKDIFLSVVYIYFVMCNYFEFGPFFIALKKVNMTMVCTFLIHSHTMTPFDARGKQAF